MDAFLRSQGSDDGGDFFLGKQYRWGGGGSRAAQLGVAVQRGAAPASAEHEMCLLGALHPGACPHTTLSRAPSAWQLAPLAGPDRRPAPHPPPPPTLPCSVAEVLTTSLLQRALVYCKAYRGVDLWRLVADAKLARLEAWMKAAMERPSGGLGRSGGRGCNGGGSGGLGGWGLCQPARLHTQYVFLGVGRCDAAPMTCPRPAPACSQGDDARPRRAGGSRQEVHGAHAGGVSRCTAAAHGPRGTLQAAVGSV
jgi:hypothetical protein